MSTLEAEAPALLNAPAAADVVAAGVPWPSVASRVETRTRRGVRPWIRRILLVIAVVWVIPNLLLIAIHLTVAPVAGGATPYPGINKFAAVDDHLWRGSAPTLEGYQNLAADGVTTIVDVRAEAPIGLEENLAPLGLELVRIPVRDGQSPTPEQ